MSRRSRARRKEVSVESRLRMSISAAERWERERRARTPNVVERSLRAAATFHREEI